MRGGSYEPRSPPDNRIFRPPWGLKSDYYQDALRALKPRSPTY